MSYDFSTLTSLTTVNFSNCGITSWSSQLPASIRNVDLSNPTGGGASTRANNFSTFNCNLLTSSCTSVSFSDNSSLSTLTNLNNCTNLETLTSQRCALTSETSFGTLPNGIRTIILNYNNLTFSTNTFFDNLNYNGISIQMVRCGLTISSIQNIITTLVNSNITGGSLNISNTPNSTGSSINNTQSLSLYTGYNTLITRGWTISQPV
jgi:hypothetical protein